MKSRLGLALPLILAGCVAPSEPSPPPPPPPPRPAPAPAPAPVPPPADWRDRAYTPGDWSYVRTASTSESRYGPAGAAPRLTIACDARAGQIRVTWPGVQPGPVTITTTYGDIVRPVQAVDNGLRIDFTTRDPLLDQMAYSRGRFMLVSGGQALIVPAWPEVARVIEDCR